MSGAFKFEDYRQPWETGPHWELKREFIEKYMDMFPEDRLLCLAQAYSNIVLMNCSYPDPVMTQISLLSKPLQMRKRFQEGSNNTEAETQKDQPDRVSEKIKAIYEQSGRPFKQVKFCSSQEQSPLSSDSTVSHQNITTIKPDLNECNLPTLNQQNSQEPSNSSSMINSENLSSSHLTNFWDEETKISSALGLEFIKNFVQHIRNFQTKIKSPVEWISHAANKMKVHDKISFDITLDPNSPKSRDMFCSKFSISDCVISVETAKNKKKAKAKSAEAAVDILTRICTSDTKTLDLNSTEKLDKTMNNSFISDQTVKQFTSADQSVNDSMGVLQMFSKEVCCGTKDAPVLTVLKQAADSLDMQNFIAFDVALDPRFQQYTCKFYIKNILISSERALSLNQAKCSAVQSGFEKLANISNYEINSDELREKIVASERTCFCLNQAMFESSVRDGFVLVDNLHLKAASQRNLRTMLSESSTFCRKQFEYRFEDVPGATVSKKACVVIGDEIISSGIAQHKDEAKVLAVDRAIELLRKKYYTLKMKNEYLDGYIISRNQVFEGESFSKGALTESNIGCKMLKSMGWTGGGLGASGISEPVEAQGHHSFGVGLGFEKGIGDLRLFKKRVESMLQDYSKTNTLSDLVFSKEFTKEERKEIHKIAGRYNLHTASRDTHENRFLTVRHKYNVHQVLEYLFQNKGTSSKFELVDASEKPFEL